MASTTVLGFIFEGLLGEIRLLMVLAHRPLSSSFLGFVFRILQGNPKKELLRGLWVCAFGSPGTKRKSKPRRR